MKESQILPNWSLGKYSPGFSSHCSSSAPESLIRQLYTSLQMSLSSAFWNCTSVVQEVTSNPLLGDREFVKGKHWRHHCWGNPASIWETLMFLLHWKPACKCLIWNSHHYFAASLQHRQMLLSTVRSKWYFWHCAAPKRSSGSASCACPVPWDWFLLFFQASGDKAWAWLQKGAHSAQSRAAGHAIKPSRALGAISALTSTLGKASVAKANPADITTHPDTGKCGQETNLFETGLKSFIETLGHASPTQTLISAQGQARLAQDVIFPPS